MEVLDEGHAARGKAVRLEDDVAQNAVDSRMAVLEAVEVVDHFHTGVDDSCAVNDQISRVDLMKDEQMVVAVEEEEGGGKHCTKALRTSYVRNPPLPRGPQVPSTADQDAVDGKFRHIPRPRPPPPH